MKWIILEENPKPDLYIGIVAVDEERLLKIENKPCSKFLSIEDALVRAGQLRDKFNIKHIRVFYVEGNSTSV